MITRERADHMFKVGLRMQNLKREYPNLCDATEDELFILGVVHDIGRAYEPDHEHASFGGLKLNQGNYKYWEEVCWHGDPSHTNWSKELDLLNYADMTVDLDGEVVTLQKRLKGISERYGVDSKVYQDALKMYDYLFEYEQKNGIKS